MMEKGKGKCIVCGHDEFAQGEVQGVVVITDAETDDWKYFYEMSAHACKHCGFIQLTSKKVGA